jgi:hypothetical protein
MQIGDPKNTFSTGSAVCGHVHTFVTVTFVVALPVPTNCAENERLAGANFTSVPVPVSAPVCCGLPLTFSPSLATRLGALVKPPKISFGRRGTYFLRG